AAKRHDVDRLPEEAEDDEGSQDGQGNGDAHHQGAPPASDEKQDQEAGQKSSGDCLVQDAVNGRAYKERLVEELGHLQLWRQSRQDAGKGRLELAHNVQSGGIAVLDDGEQRTAAAVLANDIGLHGEAVPDMRHVLDEDRRAVDRLDGQVVQGGDQAGTAVEHDLVFAVADLRGSRRQNQVLRVDGVRDIGGRQMVGIERIRVEVHHDLPRLPPERQRERGALDRGELGADEIQTVIVELLLSERVAVEAQLEDGHARGVVFDHVGREDSGRKNSKNGLHDGGDLSNGHLRLHGG